MNDAQLYLSLGVPLIFNGLLFTILIVYINGKFADYRELWISELKRVEEVIDARLKHLEEHDR